MKSMDEFKIVIIRSRKNNYNGIFDTLTALYELGINLNNITHPPFSEDTNQVESPIMMYNHTEITKWEAMQSLVERYMNAIARADLVVALSKSSYGLVLGDSSTYEVTYAYILKKPVVHLFYGMPKDDIKKELKKHLDVMSRGSSE